VLYQQPRDRLLAREPVPLSSPAMIFTPQGLMLGAGTILVPAEGTRKLASVEGREQEVLALLSAAYGRAVAPSALGNIERAAKCWSVGDDFTAHLHLAHTGLRALDDFPRAAHRLRMAKGALDHGASPRALFEVLRIDRHYIDALEKRYNPAQPRVPAGYPDGGEWTNNGGVASYKDPQILSDAPDPTWLPGAQSAQAPRGRGWSSGPIRINGQFLEPTPGQAVRLTIAQYRWHDAMSRVQRIDPNWKPQVGAEATVEGLIRNLESETREAEERIAESMSPNVPSPRGGHHWVPRAVFRKFGLPPETIEFFENSASGTLENNIVNRWGGPHAEYNEAVEDALEAFLARNAITARSMTPEYGRNSWKAYSNRVIHESATSI
jgi:hypothetical protein